ncbi:hypothetical protein J5N97_017151 [Dioscorea zingiberensis]|uniref:Uncharacterized protein n=1 Tax=Dioscorea zingiberensis TaxID=325984 RepID=A0A9D5CKN0_9LILI|nr:hypothetical protein J5N97_017151 [Dioscorea zingiberensis]
MHLWRVNANEFSYEDLVDCIHDMEFGKVEKMHYRVPNSGRSLETSLIILHSEESFANLAKHLKSNIPIEVYVEHAADAASTSNMPTVGTNISDKSAAEQVGSVQLTDGTGPSSHAGLQTGEEAEQPSFSSDSTSSENWCSTSDDDEYELIKKKRKEMEGFRVPEQEPESQFNNDEPLEQPSINIDGEAAAAKGKGKASHASTVPGQNVDSRSTNKKKAHAKSKHATATSQTEQIAGAGKGKRKTIHLTPAGAEAGSIQDQDNAQYIHVYRRCTYLNHITCAAEAVLPTRISITSPVKEMHPPRARSSRRHPVPRGDRCRVMDVPDPNSTDQKSQR